MFPYGRRQVGYLQKKTKKNKTPKKKTKKQKKKKTPNPRGEQKKFFFSQAYRKGRKGNQGRFPGPPMWIFTPIGGRAVFILIQKNRLWGPDFFPLRGSSLLGVFSPFDFFPASSPWGKIPLYWGLLATAKKTTKNPVENKKHKPGGGGTLFRGGGSGFSGLNFFFFKKKNSFRGALGLFLALIAGEFLIEGGSFSRGKKKGGQKAPPNGHWGIYHLFAMKGPLRRGFRVCPNPGPGQKKLSGNANPRPHPPKNRPKTVFFLIFDAGAKKPPPHPHPGPPRWELGAIFLYGGGVPI